jgi:hypothetical protein
MQRFVGALCCFAAGIGLGILMGLSASPVAGTVLTAVVGVTVVLVSALAGVNENTSAAAARLKVDPVPIALVVVGLVLGGPTGIYMRTNFWFGPNSAEIARRFGVPESKVKERLFENLLPAKPVAEPTPEGPEGPKKVEKNPGPASQRNENVAALLNATVEDCARLSSLHGEELRQQLKARGDVPAIAAISDPAQMEKVMREALCPGN